MHDDPPKLHLTCSKGRRGGKKKKTDVVANIDGAYHSMRGEGDEQDKSHQSRNIRREEEIQWYLKATRPVASREGLVNLLSPAILTDVPTCSTSH